MNSLRANRVGSLSLTIAALGFGSLEAAHHLWKWDGVGWTLALASFEAALIGGVADWFAVTALFRPVPHPRWRLPHTGIIARNREKLTDGMVDMVENQLLSPASVREKLQGFSASGLLVNQLDSEVGRTLAADTLSLLASQAASGLEDSKLREFLTELLRAQIRQVKLAPLLGSWLEARVVAGDARVLWSSLADTLADQMEAGVFDEFFHDLLVTLLEGIKRDLKWYEGWKGWIATKAVNPESSAGKLRDVSSRLLREVAAEPEHSLIRRLDDAAHAYAQSLREGAPEAVERVQAFQNRLAEHAHLEGVVGHLLADLRSLAEARLRAAPAEFSAALANVIERGVEKLKTDLECQQKLDTWVRTALENVLARYHGVIGATARESLNRLQDRELVAHLEMKVGSDLQYIRLNGAVIGGLVGLTLATLKWLLQ